ncbi:CBASS cGAMP synthase [Dyadobacter sp. 32]|uniref:CBASS cGAMP synthase n=1 Tax=Dyadobacter sp. 32 TaxID=538966 RepID=UPI0011ED9FE2
MANCHQSFNEFNQVIRLTENRRNTLIAARDSLRQRVQVSFDGKKNELPAVTELQFQTQGSFVMDTIINPIAEEYDLDDGIYFIGHLPRSSRPKTKVFHDFVYYSILNWNNQVEEVTDKDTCVRVRYKGGYELLLEMKLVDKIQNRFHIDLPIYYTTTKRSPDLAHLKAGWMTSDPIAFINWFEGKVNSGFKEAFLYEKKAFLNEYRQWRDRIRQEDAQLRRMVRYLKAWADYQRTLGREMPCGIILTILVAENFVGSDRDDIALQATLGKILAKLEEKFCCFRPTPPTTDDLFEGYEHEDIFMERLRAFTASARQAINETNPKRACGKWQLHFGNRFSCVNMPDIEENATTYSKPAIIATNAKSA